MLPRAHGRALVCALVACFALAPATASGVTTDMRAAYWGATVYWGAEPCGGTVELVWADLAKELNALSRWTSFGETPYSMPNANTDCRIEFNRAQLGRQDWQTLCSVAVHEVGHLL